LEKGDHDEPEIKVTPGNEMALSRLGGPIKKSAPASDDEMGSHLFGTTAVNF